MMNEEQKQKAIDNVLEDLEGFSWTETKGILNNVIEIKSGLEGDLH